MPTGALTVDEGTTTKLGTNTISEDAVTKHLSRTVLNTSAGAEVAPLTDTQLRASAVPVSAASLPLPTGAATAANQQSDALTDTELRATPVPVSGTVTANLSATDNGVLDQIELNQDAQTALLTAMDADTSAIATDIAALEVDLAALEVLATAIDADTSTIAGDTTSIDAKTPALGQALAAGSVPIVLTAAQETALTPPAAITGFATSAKQLADGHSVALSATDNAVLDNIDTNTDSGAVVGAGAAATAQRVHLADESLTALENITVVSSGTVTANAGTNLNTSALAIETGGNLASIKTNTDKIPALGQALAAASVPVILPSATITTLTPPAAITGFALETGGNLAAAATSLGVLDNAISGAGFNITQLGGAAVPIGAGLEATAVRVTLATDSTGVVSIDDNGGALTVDGTVAVTNAGITTIAGAVAGTEMQVDVLTMPTVTVNSHAVTNAGTFAVQATLAAETTKVIGTINVAASQTIAVTNATAANLKAELGASSAAIGKLTANSGVDIGDVDVLSMPGTGVEDAAETAGGVLHMVGVVRRDTCASSSGASGDNSTLNTDAVGALWVDPQGNVAHDAADAGNPVKIGLKAIAHGTNPTAVAAADRTDWYANRAGIPFFIGGHPNVIVKNFNVSDADGAQTNADMIAAVGAGTKLVVTHITVTADQATTAATAVRIGFGTASVPALDAAGVLVSHGGIAPGSGISLGNGGGILAIGGDGEELRITCEDPAGGCLDICIGYYSIES